MILAWRKQENESTSVKQAGHGTSKDSKRTTTHSITIVPTLDKTFLIFKQYNTNQSPLDPCWHAVRSQNRVNHRYEEVLQ